MEFTSTQMLLALDDYMKNNGGGSKYIASRLKGIFDDKNAPLNIKSGALLELTKTSLVFAKKIASLSVKVDSQLNTFSDVFKKTKTSFTTMQKTIDTLINDINEIKITNFSDFTDTVDKTKASFLTIQKTIDTLTSDINKIKVSDINPQLSEFSNVFKKTKTSFTDIQKTINTLTRDINKIKVSDIDKININPALSEFSDVFKKTKTSFTDIQKTINTLTADINKIKVSDINPRLNEFSDILSKTRISFSTLQTTINTLTTDINRNEIKITDINKINIDPQLSNFADTVDNTKTSFTAIQKTIDTLTGKINKIKITNINPQLVILSDVIKKTKTSFSTMKKTIDTLTSNINKIKITAINKQSVRVPNSRTSRTTPPTLGNNRIEDNRIYSTMFESFIKVISKNPLPVKLINIDSDVLDAIRLNSKREELLGGNERELISRNTILNNNNNNTNASVTPFSYRNISDPNDKESGIFGKILKWGALISGAIFAAPYLEKFLDNSEIGNKVKTFTETIFGTLGSFIDKFFKSGENGAPSMFEKSGMSLISLISRFGSFMFNGISDTLERNKDDIFKGLGTILTGMWTEILWPSIKTIGEKILAGEFLGLTGIWLLARFTPILGPLVQLLEKPLLKGVTSLGSKLFDVFKSTPLTNSVNTASSTLGRLRAFLSRLGVIGGIITAGSVAIERLHESGKIIANTVNTVSEMRELEATTAKSLENARARSQKNRDDAHKEIEEKKKRGEELTPLEKIQDKKKNELDKISALKKEREALNEKHKKNAFLEGFKTFTNTRIASWNPVAIWKGEANFLEDVGPNLTDSIEHREGLKKIHEQISMSYDNVKKLESELTEIGELPSNNLTMQLKKQSSNLPAVVVKESKPVNHVPSVQLTNNKKMEEYISTVSDLITQNIQATLYSGSQVSQTVAATSSSKNTAPTMPSFGSGDPVREQRNRANAML